MISNLGFSVMLLAASGVTAADRMPPAGSYGFNWLDPESHCKKLTEKDLAPVIKCTVSTNAFGLQLSSHMCKVSAHVELIVYRTAAQCQEALETMQANAMTLRRVQGLTSLLCDSGGPGCFQPVGGVQVSAAYGLR